MTQHIRFAVSLAAACGTAAVLSAQTPSQPQTPPRPTSPTTQQPTRETPAATTTISGCLKTEKDVPGLKPNVAERAGVGEDFILTNVKMGSTSPSAGATGSGTTGSTGSGTTGSAGSTSGSASGMGRPTAGLMYKIVGLDDDELKKHVNHQVELMGRIEETTSPSAPSGASSPSAGASDAASAKPKEFHATSLKMVSATCPAGTF